MSRTSVVIEDRSIKNNKALNSFYYLFKKKNSYIYIFFLAISRKNILTNLPYQFLLLHLSNFILLFDSYSISNSPVKYLYRWRVFNRSLNIVNPNIFILPFHRGHQEQLELLTSKIFVVFPWMHSNFHNPTFSPPLFNYSIANLDSFTILLTSKNCAISIWGLFYFSWVSIATHNFVMLCIHKINVLNFISISPNHKILIPFDIIS